MVWTFLVRRLDKTRRWKLSTVALAAVLASLAVAGSVLAFSSSEEDEILWHVRMTGHNLWKFWTSDLPGNFPHEVAAIKEKLDDIWYAVDATVLLRFDDVDGRFDSMDEMLALVLGEATSIEAKLDSGGVFHDFVDSWFASIESDIDYVAGQMDTLMDAHNIFVNEVYDRLETLRNRVTDVYDRLETELYPGGTFYAFLDNWFETIQTAITDARSAIVSEIDVNEVKIDAVDAKLGQGLPGDTEGVSFNCPSGIGAAPCDGDTPINTMGSPLLTHPKKVSLWVWGSNLMVLGDEFVIRARLYTPMEVPGVGCHADFIYGDFLKLDEFIIDFSNKQTTMLAFDQLPVPCGIEFFVERTGSAGGNTEKLNFAVVVEEN